MDEIWDGVQFSPSFASTLLLFLKANGSSGGKTTFGVSSKNLADSTAVQTIAHGLGKIPTYVKITAFFLSGAVFQFSVGSSNGTSNESVNGWGNGSSGNSYGTAYAVDIENGSAVGQRATVTVDGTNLYIHWSPPGGGAGSGTANFLWETSG